MAKKDQERKADEHKRGCGCGCIGAADTRKADATKPSSEKSKRR